jgi:hypothetical protein
MRVAAPTSAEVNLIVTLWIRAKADACTDANGAGARRQETQV